MWGAAIAARIPNHKGIKPMTANRALARFREALVWRFRARSSPARPQLVRPTVAVCSTLDNKVLIGPWTTVAEAQVTM